MDDFAYVAISRRFYLKYGCSNIFLIVKIKKLWTVNKTSYNHILTSVFQCRMFTHAWLNAQSRCQSHVYEKIRWYELLFGRNKSF